MSSRFRHIIVIGGPILLTLGACGATPTTAPEAENVPAAAYATSDAARVATIKANAAARTDATVQAITSPYPPRNPTVRPTSTVRAVVTATAGDERVASGAARVPVGTPGNAAPVGQTPITTVAARATASDTTPVPTPRNYTDPQGRFSFGIPPGWQIKPSQDPSSTVQVSPDKLHGAATVTTEAVAATTTIDQYVASTLPSIEEQYPQFRITSTGIQQTMIGQNPGRRYDLQGDWQNQAVHITQIITLKENMAYVLTLTSLESEQATFAHDASYLIDTFTIPARPL